ncbi:ankyrin repeat domain-containing protein [Chitinispirillales bacterium ANBcel5]|uniref:ankyrin repeat domain-containing protein n=1 Tax=Cellulosispirillum alkaliphilum TaxID=3039283 RepID=UPI002A552703|nr:ankyrin repeat domain-containing protein [Chitinispirillales bacterium ANBcel5]
MLKLINYKLLLFLAIYCCSGNEKLEASPDKLCENETSYLHYSDPEVGSVFESAMENRNCADEFIYEVGAYKLTKLGKACYNDDMNEILELLKSGACLYYCLTDNIYEYDLLYTGFVFNKYKIVKMLINYEVYDNIDQIYDENATTPLVLASKVTDEKIAIELAKKMIKKGANVNGIRETGVNYTNYPIIFAVKNNNIELVELFISYGVDIYVTDHEGYTPLQWSENFGTPEMVKLLSSAK